MITVYNEIIKLRKIDRTYDDVGEPIETSNEREVYAKILSIGQQEFYMAHTAGLKPELKFEIADYLDYQNESEIEHEGKIYRVLKTYRKSSKALEITVYGGVDLATS